MSVVELLERMAVEAACFGAHEQFALLASLARPPFSPARARFALEAVARRLACPEPLLPLAELVALFAELTANTVLLCYSASGWDLFAWDSSRASLLRAHSDSEFPADHPLLSMPHHLCNYDRLELRMKAKLMIQHLDTPAVVAWREGGKVLTRKVCELPRDLEKGGELGLREDYERAKNQLEDCAARAKTGRYQLVSMPLGGRPVARPVRLADVRRELDRAAGPRRLSAVYDRELRRLVIVRF